MDAVEKFLIVGLGNPGKEYVGTRHNIGFRIVQAMAEKHRIKFKHASHLAGDIATGEISGKRGVLLLPTTFMNSSGDAVRKCVQAFNVPVDQMMVVCDDVALPIGTMRIRSKGGTGGHNGLKSIQAHLNTEYYARLRIGVSPPGNEDLADYVLGRFTKEELTMIEEITQKAVDVLELWLAAGIAIAMQTANAQNKLEEGEDTNG